jgi:hypothetical protein
MDEVKSEEVLALVSEKLQANMGNRITVELINGILVTVGNELQSAKGTPLP